MHSFSHALRASLFLALTFLVGCREDRVTAPTDAGLTCDDNFRLRNGECVFVCNRDGDCPQGQRCNLLTGTCEAKPDSNDAGPNAVCTTGAVRCTADNRSVETCQENGAWATTQACNPPLGFCEEGVCLACQPGSRFCDTNNPLEATVCLDDGSGTRTVTCSGGASCSEGECRACPPNAGRCTPDGTTAQLCERTDDETLEWTWANNGDAFDGSCVTQVCQQPSPATAQCLAPACFPGVAQCKNSTTQQVCSATGAWQDVVCSSIPGNGPFAECVNGVCIDECVEATKAKSYFGCEYWSAVQDNSVDRFFKGGTTTGQGTSDSDFAFVVTNRSLSPATVTVKRWFAGTEATVKTVNVPGRNDAATRGLAVIKVPWQSLGPNTDPLSVSGKARYGYRLTSTRPVSVYQFSPLDAVRTGASCTSDLQCNETPDGLCQVPASGGTARICHYYTYSNDASLLLPSHILGTSYVAMTSEHLKSTDNGGQSVANAHITIVGTENGTTVTVKSSAATRAGTGVSAMVKDDTQIFSLDQYEVLQIASALPSPNTSTECVESPFCGIFGGCPDFCRVNNDLTGTIITSDKPIATFGGSSCSLVPHSQAACDHLEEQLFPFVTWGKKFVAVRTAPLRLQNNSFASTTNAAPDYYKIVAGCSPADCPNGTLLQINPAPASGSILTPNLCQAGTSLTANNCRLKGGDFVTFSSKASFTVTADQPISVGQFFAGQNATTFTPIFGSPPAQGDPSFVLLPPSEQWRANYTLLTAPGIKDNYLAIAIDETKVTGVEVDGVAVPLNTFTRVTGTSYLVKNQPVSVGTHTLVVKPKPGLPEVPGAGVTVYGFDSYVSYGYTGGLDLSTIVTGVNPGG